MQIYIVPTYDCNINCQKCYSEKFIKDYPNYLTWVKFIAIIKYFQAKSKVFSFIGGEPTKWKFINESILYLKNKNKFVNIFTNGIIPLNVMPNNIIVNGNNIFSSKWEQKIIQNISYYKKNGVKLRLRFNIDDTFNKGKIDNAVKLSKQFADSVSVSILYPIEGGIDYGKIIYNLSVSLHSNNIPIVISRAIPFCLFNQKQLNFLLLNCRLKGKCPLPTNSLVINPNGNSIQPCVELNIKQNISKLLRNKITDVFAKKLIKVKNKQNIKCKSCIYFLKSECLGGCLAYPTPDFIHTVQESRK